MSSDKENEIKRKATIFSKRWEGTESERGEAQSFWNEFLEVFDIDRKSIAQFEKSVKKLDDRSGKIDLFWKGKLLVEHKSKNEDLNEALIQLTEYWKGLNKVDRPRYLIVSDFNYIKVRDMDTQDKFSMTLKEFPEKIHKFSFIYSDYKSNWEDEEVVNITATKLMGELHDALKSNGYKGEPLEKYLMRILFCLFAEDTGIFEKGVFESYILEHTKEDGSDTGSQLNSLFEILNIHEDKRQKHIPDILKKFPYVNGSLYKISLPVAHFTKKNRQILLECCKFNWKHISPVIFGSMFQYVVDEKKRDHLGGHYTSERNILKVINGLFLDDLHKELEKIKNDKRKLEIFHLKLAQLSFLDPACGCGNFLIIAYRELRKLEIEIFKLLLHHKGWQTTIRAFQSSIKMDSFYGIEYEEFPAMISETAMWLMEHIMNEEMIKEFHENVATLPLKKTATIKHGNALRFDWNDLISNKKLTCIIGNPPFISKQDRTKEQQKDMDLVFNNSEGYGILDYVAAWYIKAADYINGTQIKVAFVSTNSISQGEQVSALWKNLFKRNIKIHFAHRTFKWTNEAKGVASVFVVIIGFANFDTKEKYIYEYETPKSLKPYKTKARNINPYLIDFKDIVISNRTKPLQESTLEISFGSMPNDKGNFLLTDEEKIELIKKEPDARKLIHPFIGAREFLNGEKRWCIWLRDKDPKEWRHLPEIKRKVEDVKQHRLKSKRDTTLELADFPYLFGEDRQPGSSYLAIPRVSSENRGYIPMAFFEPRYILGDTCLFIEHASHFYFGILTSRMHMDWMRQVCGRLKSDYRYSNSLVYNNFPFPENVSTNNKRDIEGAVNKILKIREKYSESTLAELYDDLAMPAELKKTHQELDKAVDNCYGSKFKNETERLQLLFSLYEQKRDSDALLF